MQVNVFDILSKVYGPRGIPFPGKPIDGGDSAIAGGFGSMKLLGKGKGENEGTPIKKYTDENLGQYLFMPVYINNVELPNAIIIMTGEKRIIETDIIEVGTVYEKVFTRPYDISIIVTLISQDGEWPYDGVKQMADIWSINKTVTLRSAISELYLQPKNNFLITKISHLDAQGAENIEVIQIDGKSNIHFELEIL